MIKDFEGNSLVSSHQECTEKPLVNVFLPGGERQYPHLEQYMEEVTLSIHLWQFTVVL